MGCSRYQFQINYFQSFNQSTNSNLFNSQFKKIKPDFPTFTSPITVFTTSTYYKILTRVYEDDALLKVSSLKICIIN